MHGHTNQVKWWFKCSYSKRLGDHDFLQIREVFKLEEALYYEKNREFQIWEYENEFIKSIFR